VSSFKGIQIMNLTTSENMALNEVAAALGVSPVYLSRLIAFESAWNPSARNAISGARGLIQFMPDTAKALGYGSADALVNQFPTIESQLRGPVLQYLRGYAPFNYPLPQSLYLAVFYPAYRYKPENTEFSLLIQRQNPGIKKVGDYVSFVESLAKKTGKIAVSVSSPLPIIIFLMVAGIGGYIIYKKRRRSNDEKRDGSANG
jgi:hypothetical protein